MTLKVKTQGAFLTFRLLREMFEAINYRKEIHAL